MHVKVTFLLTLGTVTGLALDGDSKRATTTFSSMAAATSNTINCFTQPFLGWIDQQCDWTTGTNKTGEGRISCQEPCFDTDGNNNEQCKETARCYLKDGQDLDDIGTCYCLCGERYLCESI
ncbi:hypothetical protein SLS58_007491 [Diplodia intermedia]|uniref:Uncharacterized protein n=1 Tax=Diplodia intermedia TaxID=856260 RepID=A0ABR3TK44_9PEZI